MHSEARTKRRNGIQPPFDLGDDTERAFGPDDQVEDVPRSEISVERVARGILAGLRITAGDEGSGGLDPRDDVPVQTGDGGAIRVRRGLSPAEHQLLTVGADKSKRLDPSPYTAVADRSGARGVGGNHPSERGPP